MNPQKLKRILKQVPPDYYDQGIKTNLFQKYWHQKKWRIIEKFLKDSTNGHLLDIGCADGTTTNQIYKSFPNLKITGLDFYKKAIDFARKTKPWINFVVGDAHNLPFKNGSFELVTIIETLEHLENPQEVLKEIHRVLKKNGYLIIVQDTDSLLFRLVWFLWTRGKGSVWTNSHISCMEPKDLFKLVKKAGFEIRNFDYINLGMEIFIKAKKT